MMPAMSQSVGVSASVRSSTKGVDVGSISRGLAAFWLAVVISRFCSLLFVPNVGLGSEEPRRCSRCGNGPDFSRASLV